MDVNFWDRFAFAYDWAMRSGDAGMREAIAYAATWLPGEGTNEAASGSGPAAATAPVAPGIARVLDAACGTGAFALGLAPYAAEVVATDYAPKMVERTKRKAARAGHTNVTCAVADITALPFENATFDAVVAGNVLHLLDDPMCGVAELRRVVRPGGVLILPTYVNAERAGATGFLALIKRLGFAPASAWTQASYLQFLESCELELLSHRAFRAKQPLCVAVARA